MCAVMCTVMYALMCAVMYALMCAYQFAGGSVASQSPMRTTIPQPFSPLPASPTLMSPTLGSPSPNTKKPAAAVPWTWFDLGYSQHVDKDDQAFVGGKIQMKASFSPHEELPNLIAFTYVEEKLLKNEKYRLYSYLNRRAISIDNDSLPSFLLNRTVPKAKYAYSEDIECMSVVGGKLSVFVAEASELKRVVNAFCEVWVNGREIGRTSPISNSMNPAWENGSFDINVPYFVDLCDLTLELRVFDKSRLGRISFLGCMTKTGGDLEVSY